MEELDRLLTQVRRIEEHREKGAEKEIREAYQKLLKELRHYLADEYSRYAEDDRLTYDILQKNGYYARFLEEVEQKINDITPETRRLIRSTVEQTYEYTYNGLLDCISRAAEGVELGTLKACTPDVIKRAVENPISKLTLNDRLEKHRKEIIYDIKQNISVGLINGDRYSTMANRIKQSVEGDYKKAVRIARTETHRVREAGNQDAALSVNETLKSSAGGGMQMIKTWKTMKDERVRPAGKAKGKSRKYDHRKMDGVSIPVDEEFTLPSGAKTMAPGQSGVAGEDIHCRCYLSYDLQKVEESDKIKLTDGELGAVTRYVSPDAYVLNDKLRRGESLTGFEETWKEQLDKALNKLPDYKGNLNRSVIFSQSDDAEAFYESFQKGEKYVPKQYMSTTKQDIYDDKAQVQIYIQNSQHGKDLGDLNNMEKEVLYSPESQFRVVNKIQKDGIYFILLEED